MNALAMSAAFVYGWNLWSMIMLLGTDGAYWFYAHTLAGFVSCVIFQWALDE